MSAETKKGEWEICHDLIADKMGGARTSQNK